MLPPLYPARPREKNVQLIRSVVMARSESEFDAGREAFAAALHPSLFSELDFMEETIPPQMLAIARRHVDGLFDESLPALLRLRAAELDISDEALRADVHENREVYQAITSDDVLTAAVGAERVARLRSALAAPAPAAATPTPDAEALRDALTELQDASSVPLVVQVAIQNAVLTHLDHLPSRARAKRWIREAWRGQLPHLEVPDSPPDLQPSLSAQLETLAIEAAEQRLGRLESVVLAAQQHLATHDVTSLRGFDGELSASLGPCGNCSMRFATMALSVIDRSICSDPEGDTIRLPLFNMAECPFCGHVARLSAPVMFYWPPRAQIVYCVPRMPGQDEESALREARPLFEHLRARYRARLSPEAATELDGATELVTHSVPQFLYTIQVGTTDMEWHSFLWVRLINGTWMAHDPTKNAMIHVTAAERAAIDTLIGATDDAVDVDLPPSPRDGSIQRAKTAFEAGQIEVARQELEACLARDPGNSLVRRNLAVVYLALGRSDDARRLSGSEPRGEVNHA